MSEPRIPDEAANDPLNWLDGLAGRAGQGAAHAEGQRLRDALQPDAVVDQPPWAEIERRAGLSGAAHASVKAGDASAPAEAANQAHWRPWLGVAAAVVLGTAITVAMWPGPQGDAGNVGDGMRGVGPTNSFQATWLVAQPDTAAKALAGELTGLGAQVTLQADGTAFRLLIAAPPSAAQAVNERLVALETAVDAQGRLTLVIRAP